VVCHKGNTKLLPGSAVAVHLRHGDTEGFCPGDDAVFVCHKGTKTKLFDAKALAAHLRHGDALGVCAD